MCSFRPAPEKGRFKEWFCTRIPADMAFRYKVNYFLLSGECIDAGVRFHVTFRLLISSSLLARLLCVL